MNKVRLMFTALAVFSVVGSALAYSGLKTYGSTFCAATTSGGTCADRTNKRIDNVNGTEWFRDSTPGTTCDSGDSCTESVFLVNGES